MTGATQMTAPTGAELHEINLKRDLVVWRLYGFIKATVAADAYGTAEQILERIRVATTEAAGKLADLGVVV